MKRFIAVCLCLCAAIVAQSADAYRNFRHGNNAWLIEVTTTTTPQDFKVGFTAPNPLNVIWGDGTSSVFTSEGIQTHSYATPGKYVVRLSGSVALINFYTSATPTLVSKILSPVRGIKGITSFNSTFRECTGLTGTIPAGCFDTCTGVTASAFAATFYGCTGLTGAIPTDLFRYNTLASVGAFYYTFYGCTGFTGAIPTDLFRYNTLVTTTGFNFTFMNCTGLTGAIPTDLFRYNTVVTTLAFNATFQGCTGLTGAIPTDLFRYNIWVTTSAFNATFSGCTGLTGAIPEDLFRYNTLASTKAFYGTFNGCTKLTTIPDNLFRYNAAASTQAFEYTFINCTGLTCAIPVQFFNGNPSATSYKSCFYGCASITGNSPANSAGLYLWELPGPPTGTGCFNSCTLLGDYASIPTGWK